MTLNRGRCWVLVVRVRRIGGEEMNTDTLIWRGPGLHPACWKNFVPSISFLFSTSLTCDSAKTLEAGPRVKFVQLSDTLRW